MIFKYRVNTKASIAVETDVNYIMMKEMISLSCSVLVEDGKLCLREC